MVDTDVHDVGRLGQDRLEGVGKRFDHGGRVARQEVVVRPGHRLAPRPASERRYRLAVGVPPVLLQGVVHRVERFRNVGAAVLGRENVLVVGDGLQALGFEYVDPVRGHGGLARLAGAHVGGGCRSRYCFFSLVRFNHREHRDAGAFINAGDAASGLSPHIIDGADYGNWRHCHVDSAFGPGGIGGQPGRYVDCIIKVVLLHFENFVLRFFHNLSHLVPNKKLFDNF